jgi:hypothetical protein
MHGGAQDSGGPTGSHSGRYLFGLHTREINAAS